MTSLVSIRGIESARSGRSLVLHVFVSTIALLFGWTAPTFAQNAELSGTVHDNQGAVVSDADLRLVDVATTVAFTARSDRSGRYVFASLRPATYRLEVRAQGFATLQQDDVTVTVDQRVVLDLALMVSGVTEEVTVAERVPLLRSTDGSVGTVFDRRLVEELPVRGRSFAALLALVPGVTVRANSSTTPAIYVNGQRSTSNTLRVDGVTGLSEMAGGGVGASGERFASTITGAVNGGVSMDAVQEFRIQTSSFAAEFGRTPGAQISLVTRSGTNNFHGSTFEQFRNDSMQANDWFNNARGVAKPESEEHQFGGAVGGPILRGRTFFFGSYEGIRFQRPRAIPASVPSIEARNRPGPIREILQAYPQPTGPDRADLTAEFFSTPAENWTTDTWGLRIDHSLFTGAQLFGRYARTPSDYRDDYALALSQSRGGTAHYGTLGATVVVGARTLVDLRANIGESNLTEAAQEIPSLIRGWLPSPFPENALARVNISGLTLFRSGALDGNHQRQYNVVGSVAHTLSAHQIKAGFDYRRLEPTQLARHLVNLTFAALPQSIGATIMPSFSVDRFQPDGATFTNVSSYVQDTWRAGSRLTLTLGLRWDVNPSPTYENGQGPLAAIVFDPPGQLQLSATQNVPLWKTNYGNLFPRFGVSMPMTSDGKLVVTGGVGLFGDLEGPAGPLGVGASTFFPRTNVPLPLSVSDIQGLDQTSNLSAPFNSLVRVVDPELGTPRTLQWNVAVERLLGNQQAVSASYVGARGDDLLQTVSYGPGVNPAFLSTLSITTASGSSRYHALQTQYRRRAGKDVNVLMSYTLAKSRDTASDTFATETREMSPSTFDLRHAFSTAVNWSLPSAGHGLLKQVLEGWGLNIVATGRSGFPFSVNSRNIAQPGQESVRIRASLVSGVPVVIDDATAPGGWRLNRDAFSDPPVGQQGNTSRNQFTGSSAWLFDAALQRDFRLMANSKFRIRIDAYNVFNTPVFEVPNSDLANNQFGLAQRVVTGAGIGSFYQPGAPRSVALSARFEF